MGLATLIISPILAVTLVTAHHATAVRPTTHGGVQAVRSEGRLAPPAVPELRVPQTDPPTPAPTPVPTPEPTRAPETAAPAPAPAPPPPVPAADPNSVVGIIQAAAARHGVSGDWMVKIARCESGLNTRAYNPHGPYIGLFQFLESTFHGNGGTNIYDAADQSEIAAKMLANGQAHQWSCA